MKEEIKMEKNNELNLENIDFKVDLEMYNVESSTALEEMGASMVGSVVIILPS